MNKPEANALRDEIKAAGLHCTIPRGESLPRIVTDKGPLSFASRDEWLQYRERCKKRDRMREMLLRPRTPLAKAIDDACGITWEALEAM